MARLASGTPAISLQDSFFGNIDMPSHQHAKLTLSKPLPVVRSVTSSSLIAPNGHPPYSATDWHKADGEKNMKLPKLA